MPRTVRPRTIATLTSLTLAAATLGGVSVGTAAAATGSPDGAPAPDGLIAFANQAGGDQEIWLAIPGGERVRVTKNRVSDWAPAISPRGNKIAFASRRTAHPAIYVMWLDGTGRDRVSRRSGEDPAWSPTGKRLVYVAGDTLRRVGKRGGRDRALYSGSGALASPVWSPDGSRIAFIEGPDVVTVARDGSARRVVPHTGPAPFRSVDWSPDGEFLAMGHTPEFAAGVYLTDGTGVGSAGNGVDPSWSPDSDRVVTADHGAEPEGLWIEGLTTGVYDLGVVGRHFDPDWGTSAQLPAPNEVAADLSLTGDSEPSEAEAGETVEHILTVTNAGPGTARGGTHVYGSFDGQPGDFTVSTELGECQAGFSHRIGVVFTCRARDRLAPGQSYAITIALPVSEDMDPTHAFAENETVDPEYADNAASISTRVTAR